MEAVLGDLPAAVPRAVVHAIRRELVAELLPLRASLPDGHELLLLRGAHDRALACPASIDETPFAGWSPAAAARRVGAEALAVWAGNGRRDPAQALDRAIAALIATDSRLGPWLGGLDRPALGVVRARAATWQAQALALLPWPALDRVEVHAAGHYASLAPLIKLHGRPDLSVLVGTAEAPATVLVTLGDPSPATAGLDMLAVALPTGRAPLRLVTIGPSAGSVGAEDVTEQRLRSAAGDALAVARAMAAAAGAHRGPAAAGTHCWGCGRLADCRAGTDWMETALLRRAGVPLPA